MRILTCSFARSRYSLTRASFSSRAIRLCGIAPPPAGVGLMIPSMPLCSNDSLFDAYRTTRKKRMVNLIFRPDFNKPDKRKCLSEHPFDTIKRYQNSDQFLLRTLGKMKGDEVLMCLGHNIKRLCTLVSVPALLAFMRVEWGGEKNLFLKNGPQKPNGRPMAVPLFLRASFANSSEKPFLKPFLAEVTPSLMGPPQKLSHSHRLLTPSSQDYHRYCIPVIQSPDLRAQCIFWIRILPINPFRANFRTVWGGVMDESRITAVFQHSPLCHK